MTADIRAFKSADADGVHSLLRDAFENLAEADLVQSLRQDGDMALEMVAELEGRIVGHIAYSQVEAPVWALALAPLSVAPPCQKRGIGGELVRQSLKHCLSKGWEAVFVLGDPQYYQRFGFSVAKAKTFNSPYEGDHFQALELKPQCLEQQHGNVRHANAFRNLT